MKYRDFIEIRTDSTTISWVEGQLPVSRTGCSSFFRGAEKDATGRIIGNLSGSGVQMSRNPRRETLNEERSYSCYNA